MEETKRPSWLPERRTAKRHVRKMDAAAGESGGSQPQVLADEGGTHWMTKAQNNPQGLRVLVNEYVSAALGSRLGAAVQPAAVLDVPADVASGVQHEGGTPWQSGPSFGSELLDSSATYIPDMLLAATSGASLARTAVLDTWLGANDGRQARGVRTGTKYDIRAVDFGYALGSPTWTADDLSTRAVPSAIADPNGWIAATSGDDLEQIASEVASVPDKDIDAIVESIPAEWGVTDDERKALAAYLKDRRPVMRILVETLAGKVP